MKAVVDNDILVKGATLGILNELLLQLPSGSTAVGVLGSARFIVRGRMKHAKATQYIPAFEKVINSISIIEPTVEEERLAAELELIAQQLECSFDEGESLLCAVLVRRGLCWLATGDRRAIEGLGVIEGQQDILDRLRGKVICLEQLFLRLVRNGDAQKIQRLVCAHPTVDMALAICFGCANRKSTEASWIDGLRSYIRHTKRLSPSLLASYSEEG